MNQENIVFKRLSGINLKVDEEETYLTLYTPYKSGQEIIELQITTTVN